MKNYEKYTTPEEKARTFMNRNTFCTIETDDLFADLCACLSWLEEEEELKPCPFCGGTAHIEKIANFFVVACCRCRCQTDKRCSEEEAIKLWKQRA